MPGEPGGINQAGLQALLKLVDEKNQADHDLIRSDMRAQEERLSEEIRASEERTKVYISNELTALKIDLRAKKEVAAVQAQVHEATAEERLWLRLQALIRRRFWWLAAPGVLFHEEISAWVKEFIRALAGR